MQTPPLSTMARPGSSAGVAGLSRGFGPRSWTKLFDAARRALNALTLLTLATVGTRAQAQELEPKAYSNLPVGLNFLVLVYTHSEGGLATDPALPIQGAQLETHTGVIAYARSLDLWGKSGKVDIILPFSQLSGSALVAGQPRERDITGLGDLRVRLAVNLYGAPALSMQGFPGFKPDLVIGASIQVSAPIGQYDPSKLVNLGSNRWSVKPDIGFSKAFGALILDLTTGVTFYGDNDNYFGGKSFEQKPVYSTQSNITYEFGRGKWISFGATYYSGGRTSVNGVLNDDALSNSRAGMTFALPVNRHNSVKFNLSRGVSIRTGTDFTSIGIAWQYRWGAGL